MLPPPMVIAEELGNASSSRLLLLKVNKEPGLPQIAELHVEGLNPVIPEACIFPHIEHYIP